VGILGGEPGRFEFAREFDPGVRQPRLQSEASRRDVIEECSVEVEYDGADGNHVLDAAGVTGSGSCIGGAARRKPAT
jgi:hypothetical protein